MSSPYQAIPAPSASIEGLLASVQALKQTVDTLVGLRGARGTTNQVFVVRPNNQSEIPIASKDNDLWIIPPVLDTESWQLSVWRNGEWQKIEF